MSLENCGEEEKKGGVELSILLGNGETIRIPVGVDETKGVKDLDLSPIATSSISVETAGQVVVLMNMNNGDKMPVDIDEEFSEKIIN